MPIANSRVLKNFKQVRYTEYPQLTTNEDRHTSLKHIPTFFDMTETSRLIGIHWDENKFKFHFAH